MRAHGDGNDRTSSSDRQEAPAQREIDRPSVVGIDQAEVPELGALVEVGNARRPDLERDLRQPVDHPDTGDATRERRDRGQELRTARSGEDAVDEARHGLLVLLVRRQPARVPFGLLDGLQHVGAQALDEIAEIGRHLHAVAGRRRQGWKPRAARRRRAPDRSGTRRCGRAPARRRLSCGACGSCASSA